MNRLTKDERWLLNRALKDLDYTLQRSLEWCEGAARDLADPERRAVYRKDIRTYALRIAGVQSIRTKLLGDPEPER